MIEQTKPLKQQSKGLADQQIREILALVKNCNEYKVHIDELETLILAGNYSGRSRRKQSQVGKVADIYQKQKN